MKPLRTIALLLLIGACRPPSTASQTPDPPVAAVEPVVEDYFGTRVVDPYRWMEDRAAPRFVDWLRGQDAHARGVLSAIPGRAELRRRIEAGSAGGASVRQVQRAGSRIFYLKRVAADGVMRLYVRDALDLPERVLIDPAPGTSIDYHRPSPDGRRVAYGVSSGGSENSVLHVVEVDTGRRGTDSIDRTPYAEPSWHPDGGAFYYNRLQPVADGAPETDRYLNSQVWLHRVGSDPRTDVPILGGGADGSPGMEPVDAPYVEATAGSPYLLALVAHGADAAMAVYVGVSGPRPGWRKVADRAHGVVAAAVHGDRVYLLTSRDAPRRRVAMVSAAAGDLDRWTTIVPPSERVIQGMAVAADGLYLTDLDGGLGRLRRYDFGTGEVREIALPLQGAVRGPVTTPTLPGALVGLQDWITPESWYRVREDGVVRTSLVDRWPIDTSPFQVEEISATAPDGTPIPLSIVRRWDSRLDGSSPVWLMAYGAYGVSITPSFTGVWGTARLLPFLEDGGMYAVCHVRGGGEFGEEWRLAGQLERKPNSYLDLIACAEHLIAAGYARTSALALEGASAGGLVAGMAMAVRPDLFQVVFNRVGDNNPLRLERGADGPIVATEFGSTATEAGFRALLAVDPTQHVKNGVSYPAVLLTAGFNDARVPPWQPGKLTAHLQAATSSGRPVILRVDFEGGHVSSGAASVQEHADMIAFLYAQIGRTDYQPRSQD